MTRPEVLISISEAAQRSGLSVHALRFYEREGLFPSPVRRDAGGRRLYSEWDLEWLELCTKLRSSGMPLPAIRRYAGLVAAGTGNEAERLDLLRRHQAEITSQIAGLTACLEVISFKVALYEERLAAGGPDPIWVPPEQTS
ncbi:MAG TPA: MerR family transcriptional regulator [Streptosporangiaceae bacterium]|nr:MerR family transcriptional regulator [Streptosporangiaceae bacterium]